MRKFIKFWDIIFISLAIFVFCIANIVYNYTLNKDYIMNVLRKNNVFVTINNEIKNTALTDLKVSISNVKELDINDLVDKTLTPDIIEKEVDFILSELYSTNKMRVDLSIISKGYTDNLNAYFDTNKIQLPKEVKEQINKIYNDDSLKVEDVNVFNDNYAKYYVKGKDIINKVRLYSFCTLLGLVALTLILAKEKIRGLYIPAIISAIMLYSGGVVLKTFVDSQNIAIGEKKLDNIITSIKNGLFDTINKYAIILAVIAVMLIIVKIIVKIVKGKKNIQNISDSTNVEEPSIEQDTIDNLVEQQPIVEDTTTGVEPVVENTIESTAEEGYEVESETGNEPVIEEKEDDTVVDTNEEVNDSIEEAGVPAIDDTSLNEIENKDEVI